MKRNHITILATVILLIGGFMFAPQIVFGETTFMDLAPTGIVNSALATIANSVLSAASYFVAACGTFLNVSMWVTMNIKNYVGTTSESGVQAIWLIIRDMSSMFIIFFLLYESIRMILGIGNKFSSTLKNVFVAGILINFSLYFFKVAIDISNLVSLQFYQAIAPNSMVTGTIGQAFNDGGISNILMNSLKLPTVYNSKVLASTDTMLAIFISASSGLIIMITAALSFLAAGIAFVLRTVVLLFFLGLSPLYFASLILPQLKSKANEYLGMFKNQLLFMPMYLALMYVALRLISDPTFMGIFSKQTLGVDSGPMAASIATFVQFIIVIAFINAPLAAALKLGAMGAKWAPNGRTVAKKMFAPVTSAASSVGSAVGSAAKAVPGNAAGWVGQKTIAPYGKKWGEKLDSFVANNDNFATRFVHDATRGKLEKMEKGKYGASKDFAKSKKDFDKKMADVKTSEKLQSELGTHIDNHIATPAIPGHLKNINATLNKMTPKDIEKAKDRILRNDFVAASLSTKQAEAFLKSDDLTDQEKIDFKEQRKKGIIAKIDKISGSDLDNILKEEFSDIQKDQIKTARTAAIDTATASTTAIAEIMKKASIDDIKNYLESKKSNPASIADSFIEHLGEEQLKQLGNLDDSIRHHIGGRIDLWLGFNQRNHRAYSYINNNRGHWV